MRKPIISLRSLAALGAMAIVLVASAQGQQSPPQEQGVPAVEKPRRLVPRAIPGMPVLPAPKTTPAPREAKPAPQLRRPRPALPENPTRVPADVERLQESASAGPAKLRAIHRNKAALRFNASRRSYVPEPGSKASRGVAGAAPVAVAVSDQPVAGSGTAARLLAIHRTGKLRKPVKARATNQQSAADLARAAATAPLEEGEFRIISRRR